MFLFVFFNTLRRMTYAPMYFIKSFTPEHSKVHGGVDIVFCLIFVTIKGNYVRIKGDFFFLEKFLETILGDDLNCATKERSLVVKLRDHSLTKG